MTSSPTASSRIAMWCPIPLHPSIAQTRSGELADVTPQRGKPVGIGGEPTTTQDGLVGGHHLDRDRPLVRVHPDHHTTLRGVHLLLLARSITGCRAGRATLLRVQQTLLEPLLAQVRRRVRTGQMRATRPAWAAAMRATNPAPGPSLARTGPRSNTTSSRDPRTEPRSVSPLGVKTPPSDELPCRVPSILTTQVYLHDVLAPGGP